MTNERKVKIFLTNGFKYCGTELPAEEKFYCFKDDKGGSNKKIPFTSISLIEPMKGDF